MRRLAIAITLAGVLSGVAHAGEIHPTGVVASPTPGTVTASGEIHPTGATADDASDTLITMIVSLISIGR